MGWRLHALCLGAVLLWCGLWLLLRASDAELEQDLEAGSSQERLDALHELANRGNHGAEFFGEAFVRRWLADPDPRIREAVFTNEVCKFVVPDLQAAYLREVVASNAHWWRAYVIHRRKVGGKLVGGGAGFKKVELGWWLDAVEGREPPGEAIRTHLRRIFDTSRRRQEALGIE